MNRSSTHGLAAPAQAGYRHGLSQPSSILSVAIESPPYANLRTIDDWLKGAFQVEVQPQPQPGTPAGAEGKTQAQVRALAWRVLHLGGVLLRAMKVPAYEVGRVMDIRPRKGHAGLWEVKLAVPCIDLLPTVATELAYGHAAKSVLWMLGKALTPDNAEKLYAYMEQACIEPLKGAIEGGDSTVPMLHAAWADGIPFRHIGGGVYQLGWGKRKQVTNRGAVLADSSIGARVSHDKWLSANLLRDAGLPAPVHVPVSTEQEAMAAARTLGWPLVAKPRDRDRGEGVTVSIHDEPGIAEAFRKAASFSPRVLVEREVPGVCHRILVVRDTVLLVSRRLPKSVKGDGEHTVEQLVRAANAEEQAKPPWERLKPFPLDATALECLAARGMAPSSVPRPGEWAPLRRIQSSGEGGVVEQLGHVIHPDNLAAAVKAARLFGLTLAGVDMISSDISVPWHANGAIINEVNFSSLLPNRQSAHLLKPLLQQIVEGDGRIPVEAVLGGAAAFEAGERLRAMHAGRGVRCYLTSHDATLAPDGAAVPLSGPGLFARCVALAADPQVEAIVMVVQTDELLRTGAPFDRVDKVVVTDEPLDARWLAATRQLLEARQTESM